jgi:hypothetical protein
MLHGATLFMLTQVSLRMLCLCQAHFAWQYPFSSFFSLLRVLYSAREISAFVGIGFFADRKGCPVLLSDLKAIHLASAEAFFCKP